MMIKRRERSLTWSLALVALALLSPLRANGDTLSTGVKTFTYDSHNRITSMNGGNGESRHKDLAEYLKAYLEDDLTASPRKRTLAEIAESGERRTE